MTLCLGNGPLKPTRLMGPWPCDNSRCLQGDPDAPRVSWSDLAAPRTDQEAGRGRGQAAGGAAVAGGWDELRATAGDAGPCSSPTTDSLGPAPPPFQASGSPPTKKG